MTQASDIDAASSLLAQLARFKAMQSLQASDIDSLVIIANTSSISGRLSNPSISVLPTDSQWNTVLQQANQLLTSKIASIKAILANLGVTGVN